VVHEMWRGQFRGKPLLAVIGLPATQGRRRPGSRPDEVRRCGRSCAYQRRAGEVLGGGPRAFQKYESGKQTVSVL